MIKEEKPHLVYHQVVSSDIASIAYDDEARILHVRFLDGSEYVYFDVGKNLYLGLLESSSVGSFFRKEIVDGFFRYKKIN
jgi:hypothetical protein